MKFVKGLFMGIGVLVVLIVIIALAAGGGSDKEQHAATDNGTGTEQEQTETVSKDTSDKSDKAKKDEEDKKDDSAKVNRKEYEKIKVGDTLSGEGGMTVKEVKKILGEPENTTETTSGDMTMKTMTWNAKGDFAAMVMVTFTNGKVSGKTQSGLEN